MKTFEEKALKLTEDILEVIDLDNGGYGTQQKAFIQTLIISALMAQDRVTRHACANEVGELPSKLDDADMIFVIDAMNACINTKAG